MTPTDIESEASDDWILERMAKINPDERASAAVLLNHIYRDSALATPHHEIRLFPMLLSAM